MSVLVFLFTTNAAATPGCCTPRNTLLRVTIPMHNKDVPAKTLKSIIRQAGMTVEEFIDLL